MTSKQISLLHQKSVKSFAGNPINTIQMPLHGNLNLSDTDTCLKNQVELSMVQLGFFLTLLLSMDIKKFTMQSISFL